MDEEFKIEREVELPEHSARKGNSKYPFIQMEVGDSVMFSLNQIASVRIAIQRVQKQSQKKFTTRKINEAFFRAWRIS